MIDIIFQFASEIIDIRIDGTNIFFNKQAKGFATIDQLKLKKDGVIKEFPDLKDDPQWRTKAIKRFKEKIKSLNGEMTRMRYIIKDLSSHGYKPLAYQKTGHRIVNIRS